MDNNASINNILEILKNIAISDTTEKGEIARKHYKTLRDASGDSKSAYLADNEAEIEELTGINSKKGYTDEEKVEFQNALNEAYKMFGDASTRYDVHGKKQATLDDFMDAFRVEPSGYTYNDDDRAAFSNPDNPKYWEKFDRNRLNAISLTMGYPNESMMMDDIRRAAEDFQRKQSIEGWSADNEMELGNWIISSLKGFALPRVKEAQLAGRGWNINDVAGDLAELGFNFVPGVGIVGKGGKIIAKIPNKFLRAGANVAAYGIDQTIAPIGVELLDTKLYEGQENNPRSQFSWSDVGKQTAGIVGAKGALKGGAGLVKAGLEQSAGNEFGGKAFQSGVKAMERIGEKTDELIARQQAALDRKAELAMLRKNVNLPGDMDIPVGNASIEDLINAENYRVLSEEAKRIGNSGKARGKYREAVADVENERGAYFDGNDNYVEMPNREGISEAYKKANELGAEDIIQLPDGRFVRSKFFRDNYLNIPGADYAVPLEKGSKNARFQYELDLNPDAVKQTGKLYPGPNGIMYNFEAPVDLNPSYGLSGEVSRNPAVREAILKSGDQALINRMNGGKMQILGEYGRDIGANVGFYKGAKAFGDNSEDVKRENAVRNRAMKLLNPYVTEAPDIEERRKRTKAIMDIFTLGPEGISPSDWNKYESNYLDVADILDSRGMGYLSKEIRKRKIDTRGPSPTTSYSSAE